MRRALLRPLFAGLLLGAGLLVACAEPHLATQQTPAPQPNTTALAAPVDTWVFAGARRDGRAIAAVPSEAPSHLAAASPTMAEPPPTDPGLPARIEGLLAHPSFSSAQIGVSVRDANGAAVFERNADRQLLPASTQKLIPAAAALAALGPEFRYTTALAATAEIGADGVLAGDLVLVGSGDPALSTPLFGTRVYPERPRTPLEALADQLVAAGVRHVTGGVLGDPSVFADQPHATGWLPRYFDELDAAPISGLTVDAGRKLSIRGGTVIGEPAPDPAAEAAASLYTLLRERGVTIDGGVSSTRTPPDSPVIVATVTSPTMLELLTHTMQRSDNHMAEHIFRTVGAAAGDATWTGAAAGTRAALAVLGLDWAGVVLADGSGLSRLDQVPPRFLTRLDLAMSRSNLAAEWESLMARSGESGTLRRRLKGTIAEGRVRGKTGTLQDVRSLSAAVDGPAGTRYYVAIVGNDLDRPAKDAFRLAADELVLALAEDLFGCLRVPAPVVDPASPPPEGAYELVCTR